MSRPTPIFEVMRRIRPLAPFHQASHLRGIIASLPTRSIRRQELEAALKAVVNRQLKRETRTA